MFEEFPKKRIELSDEYKKIYEIHYKRNRGGKTPISKISNMLEAVAHHYIASDLKKKKMNGVKTLEIGAGTLNHLKYECEYSNHYDIVEPFYELYKESKDLKLINKCYEDLCEVPITNKYDRIISIYTFEHILDLPNIVAICGKLLINEGSLRIAIPNEGTILWKTAYKLSSKREFKKLYNLDYEIIMKYEHVNTSKEVEEVLKYFFKDIKIKTIFGINKHLGLYRYFECYNADNVRIEDYLKKMS